MSKLTEAKQLYIIAEAAQGFEGSVEIACLLVRGAATAKSHAIKFQLVYANELCEKGYQYYELFKQLEMTTNEWQSVRDLAKESGLDFIVDVFGPKSLEVGRKIDCDGFKLHSTTFFDNDLSNAVLELNKPTYISVGGIEPDEIDSFIERNNLRSKDNVSILYGFQAEPTPIGANNLARISILRERTGLNVGFMDHSDGAGDYAFTLSAMALGMGVSLFEKHITLDHALKLEDYVSALPPHDFSRYVKMLSDLSLAQGSSAIELSEAEQVYRSKAVKRVVAAHSLESGKVLTREDIRLSRPAVPGGAYKPEQVINRQIKKSISEGQPIDMSNLEKEN